MTRNEFICLMQYPPEWEEWGMLTEELMDIQIGGYYPGSEKASEHFRNGAFHYWLSKNPSKEVLIKLAKLSFLDPDTLMAEWLRKEYIAKAQHTDEEVKQVLGESL
jgi:hypothetical protein